MFGSWKRAPPAPKESLERDRHRSIPVPMQGLDDGSGFKNSSGPEPSAHTPTPEFSKIKSMGSVTSLRRLVGSSDATNAKSTKATSTKETSTKETSTKETSQTSVSRQLQDTKSSTNPRTTKDGSSARKSVPEPSVTSPDNNSTNNTNNNNSKPGEAEAARQEDGWIWSLFRTDKQPPATPDDKGAGGAWAFWARKSSEPGQLAVSGTESEHSPRKAEVSTPSPKRHKSDPPLNPSLVIPAFSTVPYPSRRARLASLLWSRTNTPHLVLQGPARPKRVVVVGVHGYFPAKMTRAILGEPTGTSIKFANEAEARLRKWFDSTYPGEEVKIDKIALEGEGKISPRVDRLYDLLMNWESLLKEADFIFFAVHSQGAVVTINILARLLKNLVVSTRHQQVTILTMAGCMLGPMPGMDDTLVMRAITRIEHDSLAELFELQNVASPLSQNLQHSLTEALKSGIKIVLVASADDQLIPLYSALAVNVKHPNLYRAVYLDGHDVRPTVVAPLLQLATQQMNVGHTDHGLLREISGLLVGALTSKGHSKLYSHDSVYDLGLRLALETTPSTGIEPQFDSEFRIPKSSGANPYVLPWAAQALVTDSTQSKHLQPVVQELVQQFHSWKPETKPLKDLKMRLGGMSQANSKL